MGTEYRYLTGPTSQGNVRAYWLNEKESEINGLLRPARKSQMFSGGAQPGSAL